MTARRVAADNPRGLSLFIIEGSLKRRVMETATATPVQTKPWFKKWWGILLLIALWPFSLTYYIWKKSSWNKNVRIAVTALIWIPVLIGGALNASETTAPSRSVPATNTPAVPNNVKQESAFDYAIYRDIVLSFEESVYRLEELPNQQIKQLQDKLVTFDTNDSTVYDIYALAKTTKETIENTRSKFYNLDVPQNLPQDIKSKLNSVVSNISLAYSTKSDAMNLLLEYLDDPKPSLIDKYKEKMDSSNGYTMQAVASLMEAKSMVTTIADIKADAEATTGAKISE